MARKEKFGVLVIRPQQRVEKTLGNLAAIGVPAISLPLSSPQLLETPLPQSLINCDHPFDLIFTSPTAIELFMLRLGEYANTVIAKTGTVWTVGDRSAEIARQANFVRVESAAGKVDDLLELIVTKRDKAAKMIYPAPRDKSADLAAKLNNCGIEAQTFTFYQNQLIDCEENSLRSSLERFENTGLLLYSVRTARHFFSLVSQKALTSLLENMVFMVLSEEIANAVPQELASKNSFGTSSSIRICRKPQESEMIELAMNEMHFFRRLAGN